jgi:hypothetical protein
MSAIFMMDDMTEVSLDDLLTNPKVVDSEEFQRGFAAGYNDTPSTEKNVIFLAGAYAGIKKRLSERGDSAAPATE